MSSLAANWNLELKLPSLAWARWPRRPGQPPSLAQCTALALLLHLFLIVIFGNAPGGTALPGQGIWGAVNVTLRALEPGPNEPGNVAPDIDTGPTGDALRRRWGGAVRTVEPAPQERHTPGSASVGTWSASPQAPAPEPQASPPAERESATPATGSPVKPQARIGFTAPQGPPQLTSPPAAPRPESAPTADAGTPAPAPVREAVMPNVAAIERASTPSLERDSAAPLTARPLTAPAVPLPPIERLAERLAAPPPAVEAPASRTLPADLERSTEAAPALAPLSRSDTSAAPAAAAVPRIERVDITPLRAPSGAAAGLQPNANPTTARPEEGNARPSTGPSTGPVGAPDAGPRPGHDVATSPSAPASAPRLNLELSRPRGGEISSQGSRGLLRVLPAPPERPSKLAEGIEKAAKKDCRNAYSGAGLLAVIPLAADAVKGDGCKW